MIPDGFLVELRDRVTLSSVVGRRVKLDKHGKAEHTGLCPFHNEKSPSFTVNDDKQFFHCFGCGAHGDALQFVQRAYGRSFVEAVEELAAEVGMEIPKATPEERARAVRQATLYGALGAACAWFERQLSGTKAGAEGLHYLHRRGLTPETIARWRLGWAPRGDALRRALPRDEYPDDLLIEAGLLRRSDKTGELVAMFRDRVMFPITDRRGRVIGFGGRTLSADPSVPKYLNSPDTPLFAKGEVLFGLSHAVTGAADAGTAVVVEGYLDVISMHQAGLDFAVAPLGTALTKGQLSELWAMAAEPVLLFDGDGAGARAMRRAVEVAVPLLKPGKSLRCAVMPPPCKDPDEILNPTGEPKGDLVGPPIFGAAVLREVIDAGRPLAEVLWSALAAEVPPDTPERFAALERTLYARAAAIADHGVRRAYLAHWRQKLSGLDFDALAAPYVLIGESKRRCAPMPGHPHLRPEWRRALAEAKTPAVRDWLEERGVSWRGVGRALGGIGVVRARVVKGRWGNTWPMDDRPMLWEPHDGVGDPVKLIVIPERAGGPGGQLIDLIGWDPKTDALCSRTGRSIVAGEDIVTEALGLEAQGLPAPVALAATPLSWLRRLAADAIAGMKAKHERLPPPDADRCVLVVDWSRSWDALGGLRQVVAESEAHYETVNKLLRPPRLKRPDIGYVVGVR